MEVSEIEAVLGFLRKNGLAEAESAFKVDIDERKDLGSFDLEKFEFPMSPSLPPLRIATRSEVGNGCFDGGSSNSEDFVSMGSSSSTTNGSLSGSTDRNWNFFCRNSSLGSVNSGFINPYGITSRIRTKSDASSDRLSEFGTARDYHDSDLFNNMYWFDEKDGDYLKYPSLEGPDFLTCTTSEDKFVTTLETKDPYEEPSGLNLASEGFHSVTSIGCLDKPCLLTDTSIDYVEDAPVKDCNHWDEMVQPEQSSEAGLESHGRDCHCSLPQYDSSTALEEFHGNNSENLHLVDTMNEPNMTASQSKRVGEVPFEFNFETISENSMSGNSIHYAERKSTNKVGKEDVNEETDLHLVAENSFLPFRDESYETEDSKEKDGTPQESDIAGDGEECSTPNELQMYQSCEDDYEVFNLRIVHRKNRTGFEENKDLPIVLNAVIAGRYYVTEYIGSAAFSKVVQAHDLHTGVDVCLKIIKNDKEFFDQSLDEIKLLKFVNKHDPADKHHILRLYDYFYHREHLFIVCELLRANLYEFQKYNQDSGGETYFTLRRIQMITRQCLEALEYLHHLGIIHCDLKPENILIKSYSRCEVKVIDLGSSCFQTDNLCLYVQSRSYRAPEVILGCSYDQKIDIWSLGCILAELYSGDVLFPNDGLVLLLARMTAMFGPIDMEMLVEGQETHKYFTEEYELYHLNEETNQLEYIIPEESSLEHHLQASDIGFIEFIKLLLETNPKRRPTASEALQHPWLSYPYA